MSREKTTFEFAGRGKERLYFRHVAACLRRRWATSINEISFTFVDIYNHNSNDN